MKKISQVQEEVTMIVIHQEEEDMKDLQGKRDMKAHQNRIMMKTSQKKMLIEITSNSSVHLTVVTSNNNKWNQKTWMTMLTQED